MDAEDAEDEPSPLPEWKRDELRRRKELFLADPSSGCTWEEVKQQVRARQTGPTVRED